MQLDEIIEDLRDRVRALRSGWFPQQMILELDDTKMVGQPLVDGRPGPTCLDLPLPSLTCRNGMPVEVNALAELIGELLLRENMMDAHVMAALPPDCVSWRVIDWEAAPEPEEAASALRAREPDLGIPFPLSEAAIDLQPLPSASGQFLMAATKREVVDGWIEVFDQAGLSLDRLAPPQSCRLAALRGDLERTPPDTLVLLVSPWGLEGRQLMALLDGVPLFERKLSDQLSRRVREIERCGTFLRREFASARSLRLLLEGPPVEEREELEAALQLPTEEIDGGPFGSLVMKGLAIPERAS